MSSNVTSRRPEQSPSGAPPRWALIAIGAGIVAFGALIAFVFVTSSGTKSSAAQSSEPTYVYTPTVAATDPATSSTSTDSPEDHPDGGHLPTAGQSTVNPSDEGEHQSAPPPTSGFRGQDQKNATGLAKAFLDTYNNTRGADARRAAFTPLATNEQLQSVLTVTDDVLTPGPLKSAPVVDQQSSIKYGAPIVYATMPDSTVVYLFMSADPDAKYKWRVSKLIDKAAFSMLNLTPTSQGA